MSEYQRILALDLGRSRIGMAMSDPLGITAQGLPTLRRINNRRDFTAIASVVRENNICKIVLGLPLRMSGEEGSQAGWVREFAEQLKQHVETPIELRDERWTSKEAERVLRGSGIPRDERKPAVDRISAVILLQDYLDWGGGRTPTAEQ